MFNIKQLIALSLSTLAIGSAQATYLKNFNEPNTSALMQSLQNRQLHVVQLGDSHTAADEMTDALRSQLQSALGNGGMGWAMPMYFSGQRMAMYGYDNQSFQPVSSRSQREENYTLGGFIAKPLKDQATLTLKAKRFAPTQQFTVSLRQAPNDCKFVGVDARGQAFELEAPMKNNTWQTVKFTAQLPFTITAKQANQSAIGGWWAKSTESHGAIVSALGINGSELSVWNRWNRQAISNELAAIAPQLVILAYGTNEAFNDNLDVDYTRSVLIEKVRQIRQASPKTAVMIVSAPESLKQTAGQCGTRPQKLSALQQMQLQVAQTEKTLYWNWQAAMGGQCSMKVWMQQGLAASDGVHFSASGYQKLGSTLANNILDVARADANVSKNSTPTSHSSAQYQSVYNNQNAPSKGFAKICLEGNTECKSIDF